jgi:hypothetical protein
LEEEEEEEDAYNMYVGIYDAWLQIWSTIDCSYKEGSK